MKMSGHQKLKVLGTDQNIVQEIDHSCREEKKKGTKHKEIDKDPMMTTREGEGEKEKSGKKSKKKHEVVKGKETKSNVMVDDHDKNQVEKKDKKRTREKEKRDDVFNGCEREMKMKKRKKDDMMVYDKETIEKNQKEEEGNKEEQKEKMDAMKSENEKEEKKRREKKPQDNNEEKNKGKKSKKEKGGDVLNGNEDDREMKKKDDMESNNEEKKRKEKKTQDDNEEKNIEKKKKSKKERKDDREMKEKKDGMESNNEEEKKEKKRKDKKTQDDNEEKKKEKKSKKEKKNDVSNDCDDEREMKEKDNMEPNDEKKKKKSKKEKKDDVSNDCDDEREIKTGQKDDMKANNKEKKKKTKKTQDDMIADDEERKKKGKKVRFSEDVEVYPLADNSSISKETEEISLVRGKRFTKEEDELIKKAVLDYIESHRLGEEGLDMVLHCISHAKIRNCWKEIGTALPWRPYVSVYVRAHILFERGESKWTPEELQLVREAHAKYGSNWKLMAQELGKFRIHVKDAWRRIKLIDMKKGQWSQDEYQNLFELVNKDLQMKIFEEKKSKHGMLRDNISWEAISDKLGTRTNADCCVKWYNQLTSPMIKEGKWSDVDDYRLLLELVELDASCEDEVDWDNLLEHRSADVTHTRWQQMVRHLGVHGTKSFSEQVEVLSQRYCPELLQVRETLDSKPIVQ